MIRLALVLLTLGGCALFGTASSLAPGDWPEEERERYSLLNLVYGLPQGLVETEDHMIAGTSGPLAIHAGKKALEAGGTAADAAITTAMAQIALTGGSWNSFAGIFYLVYFEAATGKVHSLSAGFQTFAEETEPLTIPSPPEPSGRTAMVPGFFAGAEEASRRFGRLPWKSLVEPARYLASEGFPVDPALGALIQLRRNVLSRLPETREIFAHPSGRLLRTGDHFKQPALASTLEQVALQGASYIYEGNWAERFAAIVGREGGAVTPADLARYQIQEGEPLRTSYRGFEICSLGLPEIGPVQLLEAMNMLEHGQADQEHYAESAPSLYRLIQTSRLGHLISYSPRYQPFATEGEFSPASRLSKDRSTINWNTIQKENWQAELYRELYLTPPQGHSDAVIAVDAEGNVASLVHSINTSAWGSTGIFVDGISIPDAASFQQAMVEKAGPGNPFPNITNPVIVLQQGKPILAAATIGSGLHEAMLQNLVNVLDFGMNPAEALAAPHFWGPAWQGEGQQPAEFFKQALPAGAFRRDLLDEVERLGQPLLEISETDSSKAGYWIGIQIDPGTGRLLGAVPARFNGLAE